MIDKFFALGDKVTKGDPIRKARFDYYLLWIMFGAFVFILVGNSIKFWQGQGISYLGWAIFSLAILYFQFFTLKTAYGFVKMLEESKKPKEDKKEESKEEKIESFDEMLKSFEGGKSDSTTTPSK